MQLKFSVFAADGETERNWIREITRALSALSSDVLGEAGVPGGELGQLVFVDERMPLLDELLEGLERGGRAVLLIVQDDRAVPMAWAENRVDDILVHPFRALEVISKLQHFKQILMWDEVSRLNSSFGELLGHLKEDVQLAERLQKARLPAAFPEVKGFKVSHRYLAGLKSGGDYFDIADSRDGGTMSLLLSDSSSYGLSSSVLSVMMRVAMKLTGEQARSAYETVRRIHEEILLTLSEKDRLSLFYGVVTRADWKLKYLNLGQSRGFYAAPGGLFTELPAQGSAISREAQLESVSEKEFQLEPDGRLILLSDGFIEAAGGNQSAARVLDEFRTRDPRECLNEMVFRVKRAFSAEDDMPPQDCTAVVLDVNSRVVRLGGRAG